MHISVFKNATSKEPVNVEFGSIIQGIVNGRWKERIEDIRILDKASYDNAKRDLPAVTWSGCFSERKASAITSYSQYIILDIDNLEQEQVINLKIKLKDEEYCCFVFTSPSGKGVKILCKVDTDQEHHLAAFLHLQNYFENKYLLKIDNSGKDICRLCFVSYDPEAINKTGKVFEVDKKYGAVNNYIMPAGLSNYKPTADTSKIFDLCVKWVSNTASYVQGMRNRYCFNLACALNRTGVSAAETEQLLLNNYDLDPKEIAHVVKSSYFHNSHEHGTVEVKDIPGVGKFKAPPFIPSFHEDVVLNDLMRITAMLHQYKASKTEILDIVGKVAKYYKGEKLIDIDRGGLISLMNEAIKLLNKKVVEATDNLTLKYSDAAEIGNEIINIDFSEKAIPTSFPEIDAATRGGLMPGNFYAVIGVGGTYKSVFAQYISVVAAHLDKGVLYLNSEMSALQFYERLCSMVMHLKLYKEMAEKRINKENIGQVISEINTVLKGNMFLHNGAGYDKEAILATIQNIEAKSGKKIGMIVIDGLTQMSNHGMNEIAAAIHNAEVCKNIAKEAHDGEGIVVIGLIHVSGEQETAKIRRDNSTFVRGGGKVLANTDGYFSTSLLVDPSVNDLDSNGDITFVEDKFYLRFHDKRNGGGTINQIMNVDENINLSVENIDPRSVEIKITPKR